MAVVVMAFSDLNAQNSLAGQTFANPNIGFNASEFAGVNAMIASKRDSIISVREKKLGRKMTAKELAKMDEEIEKAKKMINSMQKAIKVGLTINFKSSTEAEMKLDAVVDDKLLKEEGVGWLQRNALKASFKMMPKSMKDKYVRKGSLIIFSPTENPDTLRLSSDGNRLTGKLMKKSYTLTRQ